MPKELTHWLIADHIHTALPDTSSLKNIISANMAEYRIGAVLPDTLLHLFSGPHSARALALAHDFHDSVDNSFAPLILATTRFPQGLPHGMLACFLGVITHILADIVFHPLVYALTGSAGIGRHYRIETDIDNCFLSDGTIPAKARLTDLLRFSDQESVLSTCSRIFDSRGQLPPEAMKDALARHCRIQSMYDSIFWKLAVGFLSTVKGEPYRNQRHLFYPLLPCSHGDFTADGFIDWEHPVTGTNRSCSLNSLLHESIRRSIELFDTVDVTGSLVASLETHPAENMLTGLHGIRHHVINL